MAEEWTTEVEQPADLETVVLEHVAHGLTQDQFCALISDLRVREDQLADHLRLLGLTLGAPQEVTAEMVAASGLGTEPDTVTRAHVHSKWHEWAARTGFRGAQEH